MNLDSIEKYGKKNTPRRRFIAFHDEEDEKYFQIYFVEALTVYALCVRMCATFPFSFYTYIVQSTTTDIAPAPSILAMIYNYPPFSSYLHSLRRNAHHFHLLYFKYE